jgi:hypothetical protein
LYQIHFEGDDKWYKVENTYTGNSWVFCCEACVLEQFPPPVSTATTQTQKEEEDVSEIFENVQNLFRT